MLIRRVGRPGLLGLAARTAVVAGTATAVSGGMMRHQAQRAEEQQEAAQYEQVQAAAAATPAPVPATGGTSDLLGQIKQLADLHASGVLSDDEFGAAKAKLLSA